MTTERKRAIIIISATFVIGLVIGTLTSGLWSRKYYSARNARNKTEIKMDFEKKLFKVVDADEAQVKVLQPIMKATMAHVDSLQTKTDAEVRLLLDSLDVKVKSVLREEQYSKFKKFISRGRDARRHGGEHHSRGNRH